MNRFISASLLATVSFLVSCNDDDKEPDYPIEPYIESADLKFVDMSGPFSQDSLKLSFYFRDGDMDLGLDYQTETDLDSPYHAINLFLRDNGQLVKITTNNENVDIFNDSYPENVSSIDVNGHSGKLATVRTRKNSGFENLPEFVPPYDCTSYGYFYLYVSEKDKQVFDESYNLYKTFLSSVNQSIYLLADTFYYKQNTNYYNITVDYLVKQQDGSFNEFDWESELCTWNFDGRFQRLVGFRKGTVSEAGPFKIIGHSKKDGEFRYSMRSIGFKTLFGGKTIKLRVKIKDRALHESNVIETNEIQIDS